MNMDGLDKILSMIDEAINTERKRHIAGGILLSASLLFGGLAITVITIKKTEGEERYELQI
jgi:hypothetical protein